MDKLRGGTNRGSPIWQRQCGGSQTPRGGYWPATSKWNSCRKNRPLSRAKKCWESSTTRWSRSVSPTRSRSDRGQKWTSGNQEGDWIRKFLSFSFLSIIGLFLCKVAGFSQIDRYLYLSGNKHDLALLYLPLGKEDFCGRFSPIARYNTCTGDEACGCTG